MTDKEDGRERPSDPGKSGDRLSGTGSVDAPLEGRAGDALELAGASRDDLDVDVEHPVSTRIADAAQGAA